MQAGHRVKRLLNAEPERRMRTALGKIRDYTDRIFRERRERLEAGLARSDYLVSRSRRGESTATRASGTR